ncbi:nuclear transport factor 2 family protein [Pseudomaricurvus alkylphenolicus]|uniref:nuclear transport factor 2 family protein n=1 Tax=Pseudomaricurvus alkylphenolicus TaxID=1306991 RepID=UPI00142094F3|nr:nuclear transport factor 2 family protein [Pseudomaricurvus alkylphenolicus]NIB38151.1 nuclear transport factor 2 family protein [Pseudomaricurvus alkylphenolicus]
MSVVDEKIAVRNTVQQYLDAWPKKDVEVFDRLFHPDFIMTSLKDGKPVFTGVDLMIKVMTESTASWQDYAADISHIQIAGPIATVEVDEYSFNDINVVATDFFQLMKIDGIWQFTAKTYHFHD